LISLYINYLVPNKGLKGKLYILFRCIKVRKIVEQLNLKTP
jgi:hypothetical protein